MKSTLSEIQELQQSEDLALDIVCHSHKPSLLGSIIHGMEIDLQLCE
jgi:hypothetical protein